ncbi:putative Ig domain-containing protein [Dactylosporangium sp. NBC_01737]|uniref:putative Ig domain-containing protein n=1 Tax=Dactylosporangium sp. NBC_01737 TaxID=2975959 RepID=UPI002E0E3565|nr:putative Ig domain-containing protein [Dactylosporangium sp. NBC_01737]
MPRTPASDAGFSLVETLTSIAIIGVVMTALTTFFVSTTTTLNKERGLQTAVRVAHDGVDLVKSLPGSSIVSGRGAKDVAEQIRQLKDGEIPGLGNLDVQGLLDTMTPASDSRLGTLGVNASPVLPTLADPAIVNNTTFKRYYFVGSCKMPLGGTVCSLLSPPGTLLNFYRVVVAVTWPNDRACASTDGVCSYVTQTMVSAAATDPVFNPSVTITPPLPDNPGNQAGDEVDVPMPKPLVLTATTAYPPLTWEAENLPPGVTITPAGVIDGTPTVAGIYVVRVMVTDAASNNDASFNWTVAALPVVAPVVQTWDAGSAVSYQVPLTGGIGPYVWSATGLPNGLTINATTGLITGTTTATGAAAAANVTVKVTDKNAKTHSVTFKWNTRVAVQFPNASTPISLTRGTLYNGTVSAYGGSGTYTWTAKDLPTGLSVSSAGVVTGTVTASSRYLVTLTVTDSLGATNSTLVPVNITTPAGQLQVTSPAMTPTPDRTNVKGTAITALAMAASGGTAPYTWAATSALPPGLTFSTASNKIAGTPTTAGSYPVTMTVTDKVGAKATFMFLWTIT